MTKHLPAVRVSEAARHALRTHSRPGTVEAVMSVASAAVGFAIQFAASGSAVGSIKTAGLSFLGSALAVWILRVAHGFWVAPGEILQESYALLATDYEGLRAKQAELIDHLPGLSVEAVRLAHITVFGTNNEHILWGIRIRNEGGTADIVTAWVEEHSAFGFDRNWRLELHGTRQTECRLLHGESREMSIVSIVQNTQGEWISSVFQERPARDVDVTVIRKHYALAGVPEDVHFDFHVCISASPPPLKGAWRRRFRVDKDGLRLISAG